MRRGNKSPKLHIYAYVFICYLYAARQLRNNERNNGSSLIMQLMTTLITPHFHF